MSAVGGPPLTWLRNSWSRRPPWPDLLLYVALLTQGTIAVVVGNRGWFSGDVIHYFTERGGLDDGSEGLNEPHQGHWQPVLIVVYRMLFALFGLRTYLPYLVVTVMVHLAIVALLYFLLVRLRVERWVAFAAATVVLTYGAGSEAFLVEAPVALTGAIALGLVALLLLVRSDFSSRAVLITNLLLLAAVMLSIGGVVASVWVGCFALARGVRPMLRCVALPATAFVAWYLWQGRDGGRLYIDGVEWLRVPRAAATLMVQPFGDVVTVPALGATVLCGVVVAVLVAVGRQPLLASLALSGVVAAMLHAVLSAIAQVPFGLEQVLTSRYRYVVLVLLMPAAALAAQMLIRQLAPLMSATSRALPAVVLAVLTVGAVVNAAAEQYAVGDFVTVVGDKTQARLRGVLAARSTGEVPINDAVPGDYVSGFDLDRLADLQARSEIPAFDVDQADRIDAESNYFVAVTGGELDVDVPAPARLESSSFTGDLAETPGCSRPLATSGAPALSMTSYNGAAITVTSNSSTITTRLVRDDLGVRGDTVSWKVEPGEPVTIATTAQVARLDVGFDAGDYYTICVA